MGTPIHRIGLPSPARLTLKQLRMRVPDRLNAPRRVAVAAMCGGTRDACACGCAGSDSNTVLVPVFGQQLRLEDSPALYNTQVHPPLNTPRTRCAVPNPTQPNFPCG